MTIFNDRGIDVCYFCERAPSGEPSSIYYRLHGMLLGICKTHNFKVKVWEEISEEEAMLLLVMTG